LPDGQRAASPQPSPCPGEGGLVHTCHHDPEKQARPVPATAKRLSDTLSTARWTALPENDSACGSTRPVTGWTASDPANSPPRSRVTPATPPTPWTSSATTCTASPFSLAATHSRPQAPRARVMDGPGQCGVAALALAFTERVGDGWHPGIAGEGVADRGQDADAVLSGGVDVAADRVPVPGGLLGAQPPGDLLLCLGRPQIALSLVGSGRDAQVNGEPQHVVLPVAQAFQQVPAGPLLAAVHALDLAETEDDAVPERAGQRRGDIFGDGAQALGPGGVRGVDQALQRLADLHRPVRTRVGLGRLLKIADDVSTAELVDHAGKGVIVLVPVVHHHGVLQVREHEGRERLGAAVAEEEIGDQAGARDQQVALAGLGPRSD